MACRATSSGGRQRPWPTCASSLRRVCHRHSCRSWGILCRQAWVHQAARPRGRRVDYEPLPTMYQCSETRTSRGRHVRRTRTAAAAVSHHIRHMRQARSERIFPAFLKQKQKIQEVIATGQKQYGRLGTLPDETLCAIMSHVANISAEVLLRSLSMMPIVARQWRRCVITSGIADTQLACAACAKQLPARHVQDTCLHCRAGICQPCVMNLICQPPACCGRLGFDTADHCVCDTCRSVNSEDGVCCDGCGHNLCLTCVQDQTGCDYCNATLCSDCHESVMVTCDRCLHEVAICQECRNCLPEYKYCDC